MFSIDCGNVVIDTVKPAEDQSGDIIVRLYEAKRAASKCTLTSAVPVRRVWNCNMLEDKKEELTGLSDSHIIPVPIRPFEVVTLRLKFK
jgi:alpha-mannosidase